MLRRLGGLTLVVATAAVSADAVGDLIMFHKAEALIRQRASTHAQVLDTLGADASTLALGPWYDSSVTFSHGAMVAAVTVPVRGPTKGSDVTVRVVRKGGLRLALAYNLLGGEWEPLMMDALVGMGPGGSLVSMSLLEAEAPAPQALPGGASHRALLAHHKQPH